MMAWRVHEFGPPNVMRFERVPRPNPGPSEVLVKVEAAGVGPWDGWIRAGKSALPQPLPLTLGSDLSGEIVAVGPGVSDLRVGDQVYGVTNPRFIGAYAEYALAFAAMVSRKPTSLTYIEAASVPVIAVTAWQALFDQAQLTAGQTVVIHGAAGNVGAYAVQLARRAGVRTIATAATDDIPAEIAGLVDGGQLSTRVGAVLPLADAREAHFMLERVRPQPKGKIVLTVGAS
jgi:NADPH:quinone reductase-like Zn-dependent oxidoreductase